MTLRRVSQQGHLIQAKPVMGDLRGRGLMTAWGDWGDDQDQVWDSLMPQGWAIPTGTQGSRAG